MQLRGKGAEQCGRRELRAGPSVLNRPEAVGQRGGLASPGRVNHGIQELRDPVGHGHDGGRCSWGRRARGSCGEKRTPSLPRRGRPEGARRKEGGAGSTRFPGASLEGGRLARSLQLRAQPAFCGEPTTVRAGKLRQGPDALSDLGPVTEWEGAAAETAL